MSRDTNRPRLGRDYWYRGSTLHSLEGRGRCSSARHLWFFGRLRVEEREEREEKLARFKPGCSEQQATTALLHSSEISTYFQGKKKRATSTRAELSLRTQLVIAQATVPWSHSSNVSWQMQSPEPQPPPPGKFTQKAASDKSRPK